MKNALLASVATLATLAACSAFAADLPSRKAPAYVPPPLWTGFYAGLNAGYNFGTNGNAHSQNWAGDWIVSGVNLPPGGVRDGARLAPGVAALATSAQASNTQSGFIGGGQIGYNYQYGSNFVLGVEADIQGAGIRGESYGGGAAAGVGQTFVEPPNAYGATAVGGTIVQGGVDWLGTVRGRVGYLWTPTLLVYGAGGFAYGNAWANVAQSAVENVTQAIRGPSSTTVNYIQTNMWLGGGRQNQLLTGWTAGGGAEWLFMPNWSVKAEALYWDIGRMDVQTAASGVSGTIFTNNNIASGRTSVSYQGVIARAGVNYHFNWGAAPVVASY